MFGFKQSEGFLRIETRCGWLVSAVIVSVAFAAVVMVERILAIRACGGEYIYPIDDTYIHITMAKMLSQHGMWGVESDKLAFCSSSPLWTLLLSALYLVAGVSELMPWLLANAFNVASLFVICWGISKLGGGFFMQVVGAVAVAVAGPFTCTSALGMEHAMHAFFLIASVVAAYALSVRWTGRRLCLLSLFAMAATATRYESLFILGPLLAGLCGLEAYGQWRRKEQVFPWRSCVAGLAAVLPVFIYGVWAISQGGHFLPNSMLLKGSFYTLPGLIKSTVLLFFFITPGCGFLYLIGASLLAVVLMRNMPLYWRVAAGAMIVAIIAQLLFAAIGQNCRYEAYLTSASAFVVVSAVVARGGGLGPYPLAFVPLAVFGMTAWPLLARVQSSYRELIYSSSDIRNQQVVMTRILAELPEEARGCIALNDLGYMALYGGFPFVDLFGLGSQDVAECNILHPGKWYRHEFMEAFEKHDVKYMVVFENWFPDEFMSEGLINVARLVLKDNHTCGGDTVIFRATSEDAADKLEKHLSKYVDKMPPRATLNLLRAQAF